MTQPFKIARYATQHFNDDGTFWVGTPLYPTMKEAKAAARKDNLIFNPKNKTKGYEVDLTERVTKWAEDIAYVAKDPTRSVADVQSRILELVRFTRRGY